MGNGDGTFQAKVDYATTAYTWGIAAADVNGDGNPDIVATNPSARVSLFQGNGDGTLQAGVAMSTGASNYLIALADLNGDGVIDLALPNLSSASSGLVVSLGSISETATASGISVPGGGAHSVLASYEGDANSAESSSSTTSLTGSTFATTLSLDVTPVSATPGQVVTLTAGVSPSSNNGYTAGGTVIFSDGGSAIGSPVNVSGGQAVLTKSDFSIGTHDITAVYSGDTNFTGNSAAASSLAIDKQSQTITFAALSAVTYGVSPLTLSGSASSELPVVFSRVSGPATISGNGLTITGAGSVVIQADQAGDGTYQSATPVLRTLVVNKAGSTAALGTSSASADLHGSVTFTATVASPIQRTPTGSVSFMDGATSLGSAAVNGQGIATYVTTSLAAGTHSISVIYAGGR